MRFDTMLQCSGTGSFAGAARGPTWCVRIPVDRDHRFRLIVIIQSVRS
jgi:hypothetical protein